MASITIEGMRFHAFHGVHEAEHVLGTEYVVDITVRMDIRNAAATDDVAQTLNYETIYQVCRLAMESRRQLIESVVIDIIRRMKYQFEGMEALRVRVKKMHPPIDGRVEAAWVEEVADFAKSCPNCQQKFICYNDESCWCKAVTVHPATKETLQLRFGGRCICPECMEFYAG